MVEGCQPTPGGATRRTDARAGPSCYKDVESGWPRERLSASDVTPRPWERPGYAGAISFEPVKPRDAAGWTGTTRPAAPIASWCWSIRSAVTSSSGSGGIPRRVPVKLRLKGKKETGLDEALGSAKQLPSAVSRDEARHIDPCKGGGTALRRYHLAMAYLKNGDLERGRQTLEAAFKMDPNLPEAQAARQLLAEATQSRR